MIQNLFKGAVLCFAIIIGFNEHLLAQQRVTIKDVNLFDGKSDSIRYSVDLVLEDDKITAILPTSENKSPAEASDSLITKYQGKFVIPGLITAHSHLGQIDGTKRGPANFTRDNILRQLQQYRASGVTSIVSLGTNLPLIYEIREAIADKQIHAPTIFSADAGIGAVVGPPDAMTVNHIDKIDRPDSLANAKLAVKQAHERGTDYIKMWVDSRSAPSIPSEIAKAVIDESHKLGLKVFAHVYTLKDAKMLVEANVDVIAHGIRDQPVDPEFIELMKSKGTRYIPTLALDEAFYIYADQPEWLNSPYFQTRVQKELIDFIRDSKWIEDTAKSPRSKEARQAVLMNQRNLVALHSAGIPIAFGTDSGAFPLRIPGIAEHRELELMVAAGLEPIEALKIATSQTATLLNLDTEGEIAVGKSATFAILDQDPLKEISALRTIGDVWLKGTRP